MDTLTTLLDTPKRASLQSQADILRTDLKEYERTFAGKHGGRKPGKDDIKADAVIAAKYKEYSRVRDVLAGKRSLDVLNTPRRHQSTRRHGRADSAVSLTPHRGRKSFSPSRSLWHPNDIDPYDPPPSISPRVIPNAIGPTPRRDGTVLGIFDLLSNSGSKKSTESAPGSRKRKVDVLYDGAGDDGLRQLAVTQTPSQKLRQSSGTANVGLQATTPSTRISTGKRQHSKTPISEGRKFMLDHFFATPSAVRFATVIDGDDDTDAPTQTKTPLCDFVHTNSPTKDNGAGKGGQAIANVNDSTPPYLKRTFSFKDRLFAASGASTGKSSPTSTRRGPRRSLGYVQSAPKPLSQIIADLQQSKQDTQQRNDNDNENEDDLDALREMEASEVNVLVNDSQTADGIATLEATGEEPVAKVWKKKGQKRTTRRVIMRPVKMKPSAAPKFVADDEDEDEGEDVGDRDKAGELAPALEDGDADVEPKGSDMEHPITEHEESNDEQFHNPGACDDVEEFLPVNERAQKGLTSRQKAASKSNISSSSASSTKTSRKPLGCSSKGRDQEATTKAATATTRTINPNAYAHMNFRSLKIKNKNSRAKRAGAGRFSRGRR
ncbi:uncharacterized protein Z519_10358 [Cladophialophora bantiana CBS 173.52]|uniref:DNA replication regulator SLD2 n=1 Tax=Cladophialophora bantiana (strain ATCC 10958 / CBS 173.52 / CDC B-1940 / NIH 8579) TaxID=1442370 RepID=A0A0D2HWD6_CLAB1|nr:uncharacterized protein Z519_10358 [Cladophialophora bantiana CBS 173.52]KIW88874.1 hypothetical protein Z519_10358 [Cladophialophora bantiana CBS 173.52]